MTDLELHGEHLAVLPLRLETVTISGGEVTQKAAIEQINFNNQIGGSCLDADCTQTKTGVNTAAITQRANSTVTITDVIEDSRLVAQAFSFGGH